MGVLSSESMLACETRLTSLLAFAPWCVMLQYNMHMDTPAWITARLGVTVEEGVATGLLKTIRVSEELLWSGRTFLYTRKSALLYACLRAAVLSGYGDIPPGSPRAVHSRPVYCVGDDCALRCKLCV